MQWIRLAAHYTSGMIFQRNWPILVEGEAFTACEIVATLGDDSISLQVEKGPFSFSFPPRGADRGLKLSIRCNEVATILLSDVYIGEVWFAGGQSNMLWPLYDTDEYRQNPVVKENTDLRFYTVGRNLLCSPEEFEEGYDWAYTSDHGWVGCDEENALHFSAVAYHFAHTLYDAIKVPIGIINCNVNGSSIFAWLPSEEIKANRVISHIWDAHCKVIDETDPTDAHEKFYNFLDTLKKEFDVSCNASGLASEVPAVYYDEPGPYHYQCPEILYKAMLERVSTFPARGMLWYQGETNCNDEHSRIYAAALESLVGNMKHRQNNPDFAFNFVQLAPFLTEDSLNWAIVCDQMRQFFLRHPDYAMVTIGDVGCALDIHPQQKRPVGERLAYAAMHRSYDLNHEFTGPIAESAIRVGNEVRISFIHAAGLHQRQMEMGCFELIYEHGTVIKAMPEIRDNAIYLPLPEGPTPKTVRYEFVSCPNIGLYNSTGYPASLFELPVS